MTMGGGGITKIDQPQNRGRKDGKMNIIILVGFIASMLGLQVSPTGAKYLRFDLAVKNSAANNNSTTFVKCVAFGKTAEFIATFFKVGSPIGVIAEVRNIPMRMMLSIIVMSSVYGKQVL